MEFDLDAYLDSDEHRKEMESYKFEDELPEISAEDLLEWQGKEFKEKTL